MQFENNDIIHFKVLRTEFKSSKHLETEINEEKKEETEEIDIEIVDDENVELLQDQLLKLPMIVHGTMDGDGLGSPSWWG